MVARRLHTSAKSLHGVFCGNTLLLMASGQVLCHGRFVACVQQLRAGRIERFRRPRVLFMKCSHAERHAGAASFDTVENRSRQLHLYAGGKHLRIRDPHLVGARPYPVRRYLQSVPLPLDRGRRRMERCLAETLLGLGGVWVKLPLGRSRRPLERPKSAPHATVGRLTGGSPPPSGGSGALSF
jgi:hypothetical protein